MQVNLGLPKKLPGLIDSTHFFKMLFGGETNCKSRKSPLLPEECAIVASYHDNHGETRRLFVCDLAFANSAGAALSAIPACVARLGTKSGKVEDNFFENLSEVMNIAINLFTEAFGGRLELQRVQRISEVSPIFHAALRSEQRVKLEIVIPRYDAGRVDLIAIDGNELTN